MKLEKRNGRYSGYYIDVGNPLKIRYKLGSFFSHEEVEDVKLDYDKKTMIIETTKKIWTLSE